VILVADVVVLIPTLGRPHHIKPLLESLYDSTDRARPLFICNKTDTYTIDAIEKNDEEIVYMRTAPGIKGDYARKINTGYKHSTEPLMFLGATDLIFHKGWLEKAEAHLGNGIHVVGTNDLGNVDVIAGRHSTHSLVTREYVDKYGTIDEGGKVLCEEYWHEWVDNEFCETARYRNAFAMAMDSIVEHVHPAFGKNIWDENYRAWRKRTIEGGKIYEKRQHLWM
jgi:glycosyltransferase involved in cell wall biosynthesis